jgi:hypothetical protein
MIGLLLAAALLSPGASSQNLSALLRAKDQALLDAIAPGDRQTWDRLLAPEAVYVDENGAVMDRAAFLNGLSPLPSYASGHIDIVDYRVQSLGDTALVVHKDDEREVFYGHDLRAGYLMTETWIRRGGEWRVALIHAYVTAVDPPAATLPPAVLDAYVGRYQLAPGVVVAVRRDGDHLVSGREGKPAKPLLAESADVFFTLGQPRSRTIFQRKAGAVHQFVDRREGEDLIYFRLPE